MSEQTAENDATAHPLYYESQTFMERLFRRPRRHDCRSHLPRADRVREGVEKACPMCGTLNQREDYDDDDLWGGTATYCTWRRVIPPAKGDES